MKTKFILSLLMLTVAFGINARHITEDEALAKAKSFITSTKLKSANKGLMKLAHKDVKSDGANYYVFSKGENAGFIIVSGSDKTDEILGYVDSGNFDVTNLPANVAYWLGEYSKQVEVAEAGNYVKRIKANNDAKTVAPLLGVTMWNQDAPYNDKCPVLKNGDRCATGCVATAFAQVMYYHKWPETGVGSNSYVSERAKYELSADFGATTYHWDLMTPYYNTASTAEAKDAVAELMLHVGISCFMDYEYESGAMTNEATLAMAKNFRYDDRIRCLTRDYFSRDEWDKIIKDELDAKRPVPYGGMAVDGGHQFVLDGYDTNDMFHVNWGWGGYCDGYFKISILNPGGQGIGGFEGGYNSYQCATVFMMKPDSSVELPDFPIICIDGLSMSVNSVNQGTQFTFTVKELWNLDSKSFNGLFNLGLFDAKDDIVAVGKSSTELNLDINHGWVSVDSKTTLSNVPDGTYFVYPVEKPNGTSAWRKANYLNNADVVTATVKGNNITFGTASPNIQLQVSDVVIDKAYEGFSTKVRYKLTNLGVECNEPLYVAVCEDKTSGEIVYLGESMATPIVEDEILDVETIETFNLKQGEYYLTVINKDYHKLCDFVPLTILPKPAAADLSVDKFEVKSEYSRDDFNVNVVINNNGGLYQNSIILFIYSGNKYPSDYNSYVKTIENVVSIPGNSTGTAINFSAFLSMADGDYFAIPAYIRPDNHIGMLDKTFTFKLNSEKSGVEVVENDNSLLNIYPNPVEDVLNLSFTGNLEKVSVFNMNGTLVKHAKEATVNVSELAAGNYIVVAEIDGKSAAKTFIKK